MIIVTGCPRSGTSLMMQILRKSLGEHRVIGEKFPMSSERAKQWLKSWSPQITDEYVDHHAVRMEKDCPGGFWEHWEWTMHGVREPTPVPPSDKVCKLVGLGKTDGRYVDKVIYMMRDPAGVAKSFVRLANVVKMDEWPVIDGVNAMPGAFNRFTNSICTFLARHNPPTLVVDLHDLRTMPELTFGRISAFLGERVTSSAVTRPTTQPVRMTGDDWGLAYELADLVRQMRWPDVLETHERHRNAKAVEMLKSEKWLENLPCGVKI